MIIPFQYTWGILPRTRYYCFNEPVSNPDNLQSQFKASANFTGWFKILEHELSPGMALVEIIRSPRPFTFPHVTGVEWGTQCLISHQSIGFLQLNHVYSCKNVRFIRENGTATRVTGHVLLNEFLTDTPQIQFQSLSTDYAIYYLNHNVTNTALHWMTIMNT